jgi:integrase
VERRKDSKGRVLKEGEIQRKDGSYEYRWRSKNGKRNYTYARTLDLLREKEEAILKDKSDGIRIEDKRTTINDVYELWIKLKKGLKENTFQNYKYMYNHFVYPDFGKNRIMEVRRSDVRRFYNNLIDNQRLKVRTLEGIHTILYQVFELAMEDNYLRSYPCINAVRELKKSHNMESERRRALTLNEQELFLSYLKKYELYWYPVFLIMMETGLWVGELTGLRWEDIDLENRFININHTLVYFKKKEGNCAYGINTPKIKAGYRSVPMTDKVVEAFSLIAEYQKDFDIECKTRIDLYTDFIFLNHMGTVHNQNTLNKAIRRITRDCNDLVLEKGYKSSKDAEKTLIPKFSSHCLRHTFATRMCESGINIKVVQDVLGHADISTTMNIYTDATEDLKTKEIVKFENYIRSVI